MRPAGSLDELISAPGRYLVGDRFVAFGVDRSLFGFLLWGRLDRDTLAQTARVDLERDHGRMTAPCPRPPGDVR